MALFLPAVRLSCLLLGSINEGTQTATKCLEHRPNRVVDKVEDQQRDNRNGDSTNNPHGFYQLKDFGKASQVHRHTCPLTC